MHRATLLALLGSARLALAGYSLADDYLSSGDSFWGMWDYFTDTDPTGGFVDYVDQSTAQQNGYIKTMSDGSAYIGVDYTNVASGSGRQSVRLSSSKTYTHYLTVIDVAHMPGGICGTWPAFWSFGSGDGGWPNDGEIDIIEGANDQQTNYMSLHTSEGCSISDSDSLVKAVTHDCNADANGNQGCSFHDSSTATYGSQFNAQGGGTYAAEWNSEGISIWYWPHGGEPSDILGHSPDPTGWGNPRAKFSGSGCDWDDKMKNHNLVFDTTFCGSWAGEAFQSCSASNNGQTCESYVQNNPSAFKEAYWQIRSLKVYQEGGSSSPEPSSPGGTPTVVATAGSPPVPTLASSVVPIQEQSSGGIFLPSSPQTMDADGHVGSAPAVTAAPAPINQGAAGAAENGGEAEEPCTTAAVYEQIQGDGEVYRPGSTRHRHRRHAAYH